MPGLCEKEEVLGRPIIAMVGGGSYTWCPWMIRDTLATGSLAQAEFRLLDIDLEAAREVAAAGARYNEAMKADACFVPTGDAGKAFEGADFVVITISTGGHDAMRHDLKIPERYGIYATVGDTVGPGGWARSLRNVPVFAKFAAQMKRYCPGAFVLNYSNPMGSLTRTLSLRTNQPVVGLCHGLFENIRQLMRIFRLTREEQIGLRYAGINHFFWILDFTVKGKPGYPMLRRKLRGGKRLDDLIKEVYVDGAGHASVRRLVASELFEEFGVMPYLGDRHTCEFFNRYLAPGRKRLRSYGLVRTGIAERRAIHRATMRQTREEIAGKRPLDLKPSRETASSIMSACWEGKDFVDVMNLPNTGQIANLPHGPVVETAGVVNATGFAPISCGGLPNAVLNVTMPHVLNQELVVEAGLEGNWEKAYQALINDPLCGHLPVRKVKQMGRELLEANRRYLPQFFGRRAKRR